MPETTDRFRLIQEIDQDVLGAVHCAAWTPEDASEEIMLLRLFDRSGIDPDRFLQQVAGRQTLLGSRISDQLLPSRQLGVVEGQAFDLAPYVSGRSLASLIAQAIGHRETFPVEVALFIVGRVAAGLGAAYRHGIDGAALLHGFVTPHMIRVSEEGRVALAGLEAAPALRHLRGTASTFARILPYLAPESLADENGHRSDDVYSLGVVLHELLTLRPLASPAELRLDNPEIPAELRYFLDRSVAPRFRRIPSVLQWSQELKALVIEGGWPACAQDLSAFFAGIDERLHPLKPDTSEVTASDREALAQAIRKARSQSADSAAGDLPKAREAVFQTMAIPTDILETRDDSGSVPAPDGRGASGSVPI